MITAEQAYALEDLEQATDALRNHQFSNPLVRSLYEEAALVARDNAEEVLSERTVISFLETHLQKHLTRK